MTRLYPKLLILSFALPLALALSACTDRPVFGDDDESRDAGDIERDIERDSFGERDTSNHPDAMEDGATEDATPVEDASPDIVSPSDVRPDEDTPEPPDTDGEVDIPDVDTPDVDTPDVDIPDVDTPDVGMPDAENPDVGMPDVDTPDVDMPDVDTPGCQEQADCASGEVCVTGQCQEQVCEPDARECVGDVVQGCNAEGTGYLPAVACEEGTRCQAGECVALTCEPGAQSCLGDFEREVCNEDGSAWSVEPCAEGSFCDAGTCAAQLCTPDGLFCDEDDLLLCDARGAGWSQVESCPLGCAEGACVEDTCGVGGVDAGEECDDLNMDSCDGCAACRFERSLVLLESSVTASSSMAGWAPGAELFTIEAWIKPDAWGMVVGMGEPSRTDTAFLMVTEAGFVRGFMLFGGSGSHLDMISTTSVLDGGWHHVALVRTGLKSGRLFVNGNLVDIDDHTGPRGSLDTGTLWLGSPPASTDPQRPMRGKVDEVRISSSARYHGGYKPTRHHFVDAATQALYRFDHVDAAVVVDAAGSRDIRLFNALTGADECFGATPGSEICGDGLVAPWETCDEQSAGCSVDCDTDCGGDTRGYAKRNCYRYTPAPMSWTDAEASCVEWGGHLVTINRQVEEEFIHEDFGFEGAHWIGLNDRDTEGRFRWSSGQRPDYESWGFNQPGQGGGDCVEVVSKSWTDVSCSEIKASVCERLPF